MSTAEILAELPKLSPAEQEQIRAKLDELAVYGPDGWLEGCDLTEADKRLIEARLAAYRANPDDVVPWEKVKADLRARFGE